MESKGGYDEQEGKDGEVDGSLHSPGARGRGRDRKGTDEKAYDRCAEEKGSKDCSEERGDSDDSSDAEVEVEYLAALKKANIGRVAVSKDPQAQAIVQGFRINWMDMRDAETATLMWESEEWGKDMYEHELKATVPREILECSAVSREINFTSKQEIRNFQLEQRVFLGGACIEEWFFDFGFVIPGSTNSWQQTIESAGEDRMLAAEDLSGRMTIETTFLDGKSMLFKTLVRIFYE
eukprot:jgi/Undpi1/12122/HiC_scaffold_5.g01798.m1